MVKEAHSSIISGVLFGAGAGVFWGLVFLAPQLVPEFTSLQLVVGRFLAYGVISLILAIPKWSYLKKTVSLSEVRTLLCLALLGNTLYYTLLSNAVKLGGIALTSLILGFLPVTVSIIGSRDAEAIALRRLWPSLSFCIAGAFCIGAQALTTRSGHPVTGLFLALGALASWTAYAVGNSRALSRLPHLSVHDWNLLTGLATGFQAVPLWLSLSERRGRCQKSERGRLLVPESGRSRQSPSDDPFRLGLCQWRGCACQQRKSGFLAEKSGWTG